jgi:hypothetical protein
LDPKLSQNPDPVPTSDASRTTPARRHKAGQAPRKKPRKKTITSNAIVIESSDEESISMVKNWVKPHESGKAKSAGPKLTQLPGSSRKSPLARARQTAEPGPSVLNLTVLERRMEEIEKTYQSGREDLYRQVSELESELRMLQNLC